MNTGARPEEQERGDLLLRDRHATWLLAAITSRAGEESAGLFLRGGAALRYLYYPNARLTPDLDYALCGEIGPTEFGSLLTAACLDAGHASGAAYEIVWDRENPGARTGTVAHSWSIANRPSRGELSAPLRLRISVGLEKILSEPVALPLVPRYPGLPSIYVPAYALEELVAEKLQALVPGPKPLRPHAAGRKHARHLYDTWFVLSRTQLDIAKLSDLYRTKCRRRNLALQGFEKLLTERHLVSYRAGWTKLSRLTVEPPPELETVLAHLEGLNL